jgi:hypothetical protein
MFYEKILSIPKLTSVANPASVVIPVHPGRVNSVEVFFPDRCAGLAHLVITMWGRQVWPSNPDSFFTGDGTSIKFAEDLDLVDPPYEFVAYGWNDDDTYLHEPIVRIEITPADHTLEQLFARLGVGPAGPATLSGG